MPFSPKRLGSVSYATVMFVVVSALAGLLVAGLIVPIAGLAGASSRAVADQIDNLPASLNTPPQSQRSKVLLADGTVLTNFYDENRIYVPLRKIAPVMRQAQVAIEDSRFYEHGALDVKGTVRAFVRNQASSTTQGGSSITQQLVKMSLIEAAVQKGDTKGAEEARKSDYGRKIRELRYAMALEKKLSKDQILERYLNIAYYGEGAYGVEAAAQHYFSVSAAHLSLAQAAMLAGLVQSPDSINPVRSPSKAIDRRDFVLNRMVELKVITPAAAAAAKKVGFDRHKVKGLTNGCLSSRYPFLCDYVRWTLLQSPSLGKTPAEREATLKQGGLTIYTHIDPKTQKIAQKAVSNKIDAKSPAVSVMTMIQPGTGLILAMAQSRPVMGSNAKLGQTYFNLAVTGAQGGAEGYQAGSTFKAFTTAAALEQGIPLSTKFEGKTPMDFTGKTFTSCDGAFREGHWVLKNSTGNFPKPIDMSEAAAKSVNTWFVQLEQKAGICETVKMAAKLGVKLASPGPRGTLDIVHDYNDIASFTLGTAFVSPLSMTEAYATFAARGVHCNPIIVSRITTAAGKDLPIPSANCQQVISKEVADGVNKVLTAVMKPGGTGNVARLPDGRPEAGKTGTIDNNQAVWFAGYTPEVAGVAMISIDRTNSFWKHHRKTLKSVLDANGYYLQGHGGSDVAEPIWKPAMWKALKNLPATGFKHVSKDLLHGKMVDLPDLSGLGYNDGKQVLEDAGFSVGITSVYSGSPAGTPLGWSQYSGKAAKFSTVYWLVSAGQDPAVVQAQQQAQTQAQQQAPQQRRQQRRQQRQQQTQQQPQTAPTKPAAPKTTAPTKAPTTAPTTAPTKAPTTAPTKAPTTAPTAPPSKKGKPPKKGG